EPSSSGASRTSVATERGIMAFTLTEEQQELAAAVAAFLDKHSPETEVRRLMERGAKVDPAVWKQITEQLGLTGLVIPEEYGGGGFSFLDFALVAECAGAALLVAPLLSTVSAASALMLAGNDLKKAYLPGLASGERIGTLAFSEQSGSWNPADVQTVAEA